MGGFAQPWGMGRGGEERRGVGGRGIPKESLKTAQPCRLQQQDQHSLNLIPTLLQMHGMCVSVKKKKVYGGGTSESARKKERARARASSEVALSLSGWNGGETH